MSGILIINKPSGMSSFDVIRNLRKNGIREKTGYVGTLDPMAKGVLPLLSGKATKLADYFSATRKSYLAKILFGKSTDSYDITGNITEEKTDFVMPDVKEINKTLNEFRGKICQVPPPISAKKINGKRAYSLFRKGEKVELQGVEVEIFSIKNVELYQHELIIEVYCSKGTYIRSIAHDIGIKLGIPAVLSALTRTSVGDFSIEDAVNLDKIQSREDYEKNVKDPSKFLDFAQIIYTDYEKVSHGIFIKNTYGFENGKIIKVLSPQNKMVALYKVKDNILKPEAILI
ncbi:MAG: tRNA pseudouridine(55) synthase TruB [Candidatus Muiribacteriota bacterium]